jgi:hypothetical protein
MNRHLQEFFWMPEEVAAWTTRAMLQHQLWAVVCVAATDALLLPVEAIQPSLFNHAEGDSIQVFVGARNIAAAPVWRTAGDRRSLDVEQSYAIQIIPPLFDDSERKSLLLGQIAILRSNQYDDPEKAARLIALFNRLRNEMMTSSDPSRVVVQILSNGDPKLWKDILVGKQVPKDDAVSLKQFAGGEVTFRLLPAASEPLTKTRH